MSLVYLCGQGKYFTWNDSRASLLKGQLPSLSFLLLPACFLVPGVKFADGNAGFGRSKSLAGEITAEQLSAVKPALALATNPACWMVGTIKIELVLYYRPGRRLLLWLALHNRARIDLLQEPSSCASKWHKARAQDSLVWRTNAQMLKRCKALNAAQFLCNFPFISVLKETRNLCRWGTDASHTGLYLGTGYLYDKRYSWGTKEMAKCRISCLLLDFLPLPGTKLSLHHSVYGNFLSDYGNVI